QAEPEWFDPGYWGERARPVAAGGRGGAWFVDAPFGRAVLRFYLRGGLPAKLSRDRYLWRGADNTRGFAEFRLTRALRTLGLPVRRPIPAAYWRHGLTCRAAILLGRLEEARPLAERAAAQGPQAARRRPPPRLRRVPAHARAARARPAGAARDRRRVLAPRPALPRRDPARAPGGDAPARRARRRAGLAGAVGEGRQAGLALPPRWPRPRRPQRPQSAVRRPRPRQHDRLRQERDADPRDRLARGQPRAPAPLAAQAPRQPRARSSAARFRPPVRRLPRRLGARHLMDAGESRWSLRFHGVGNSHATALGSAMATIERDG